MTRNADLLDQAAFHQYIYDKADRYGVVNLLQKELAESLGVDVWNVWLTMQQLVREEKVRLLGKHKSYSTYVVKNPKEKVKKKKKKEEEPPKRKIQWG